ncbi:glycosyltransferase family 2 protein [Methylomicrobium sp. RS1]|jgi:glycosyltransferase involved in cell wall biosynthesis|uniref:glycosyltransferase family 2 protein n=1 Tax=Candidatus Methylomicrobium oryzae TaxID=2802053 RepID=UPI001924AC34|nr:glycosyltransferase family 2 protein [Methylomicrobium sp. RS1]MBL1263642.1 glycosyltransferase family 2 protein [Methylomicrobium sp. RS1]
MAHISVVIPVYKAEDCMEELYRRLVATLEAVTDDFEIILVEDCGGDNSWPMISDMAQRDQRVKGIQFSRNFGQHYGITAGLDYCDGDWVVVMDCDLQDRPEEIPRLYQKAQEGFDVVMAKRRRRNDPALKRFNSWLFYKVFRFLAEMDYDGETSNFRIISRKVVISFRTMRERLRFFGGLVAWMGFPTASIDVQHDERFAGQTTYTFRKLWKLASETIVAYSDKPLRLAIRFGFLISALAFGYGGYIIYLALEYGTPIMGWSSLIVSIYFLGGIIISILGILGVYLGNAFDETKRRPLYIISQTTFKDVSTKF